MTSITRDCALASFFLKPFTTYLQKTFLFWNSRLPFFFELWLLWYTSIQTDSGYHCILGFTTSQTVLNDRVAIEFERSLALDATRSNFKKHEMHQNYLKPISNSFGRLTLHALILIWNNHKERQSAFQTTVFPENNSLNFFEILMSYLWGLSYFCNKKFSSNYSAFLWILSDSHCEAKLSDRVELRVRMKLWLFLPIWSVRMVTFPARG